ncbi:MauE/DoxX family redox-associated membrane protein [Poriferisphaera sp. WC338]|uniref:MauE/DoxX family redox-associated membrane protein n=1 Tax=Poriferisphaera sp. WC338 TaxID=3425129 RepID=UPI003D817EBE
MKGADSITVSIKNFMVCLLLYFIAVVFFIAGAMKMWDIHQFVDSLDSYQFFPELALGPVAFFIPSLEMVLAICLLLKFFRLTSLIASFLLLLCFTLVLMISHLRGIDISCGCFGALEVHSYVYMYCRNIILMLVTLFVLWQTIGNLEKLKSLPLNISMQSN